MKSRRFVWAYIALIMVAPALALGMPAHEASQTPEEAMLGNAVSYAQTIALQEQSLRKLELLDANEVRFAQPSVVHIVVPGDTLVVIAERFGVGWKRVFDANSQIQIPSLIEPGWQLRIPSAEEVLVGRWLPVVQLPVKPARKAGAQAAPRPASSGSIKCAAVVDCAANRDLGRQMAAARGWAGQQWGCLDTLWGKEESGWNHLKSNNDGSGAYGIPQALPGKKMATAGADWATNPATQIAWGLGYIAGRYQNPCGALAAFYSRSPNWY